MSRQKKYSFHLFPLKAKQGLSLGFLLFLGLTFSFAQDIVHYSGNTLVNVDYHHGQLTPVVGVHNIQVMRPNREHPELAGGSSWTYNHAPMLAYWNNLFYLEYLSTPVGEHVPPGQTLLVTSKDGYHWTKPAIIFPPFHIPDGTVKEGRPGVAKDLYAVMHQRMGFYVSKKNRLLVLAFYGIMMDPDDDPLDGKGIGRVVREVLPNGTYGPIYFIHYNSNWKKINDPYAFYTTSKDKGFVEACNELLATPLMMQQWVEESDRDDALIPIKKQYKAFCYYHLPDKRVVGLWKNALTGMSNDEGKTWSEVVRAPKFVNSNAKIWGQRTSDGKYATVYNPSEFRWPLAISTSEDGLNYTNLLLVHGEVGPKRYEGHEKSFGPQYVRGIIEGNGTPPDGNLWVTYSMNKEDIWISTIPVPVKDKVEQQVNEVFSQMKDGDELKNWNTYSPLWAPVSIQKWKDGTKCLALRDSDKFDYAKAERVIPASKKLMVEFSLAAQQNNNGLLHIEFQNDKGAVAIRLIMDSTGLFTTKIGAKFSKIMKYEAGKMYDIKVDWDTDTRFYNVYVDGKVVAKRLFFAPVESISRIVFRTGEVRHFPTADTPAILDYDHLPDAGGWDKPAAYFIKSFKTHE
jgi:hypothetical protein